MKITERYEIQGASDGLDDHGQALVKAACEEVKAQTRSARIERTKARFDDLCSYVSNKLAESVSVSNAVAYFEGALRGQDMPDEARLLRFRLYAYLKSTKPKKSGGKFGGFERGEDR